MNTNIHLPTPKTNLTKAILMAELGMNREQSALSRISRKSILDDKGVNLCQKCKGILNDEKENEMGDSDEHLKDREIDTDELVRRDIDTRKSILMKVQSIRKFRNSKMMSRARRERRVVKEPNTGVTLGFMW